MFAPQQLGVSGQPVGKPQMIARGGRDQLFEPLPRHLIGQQFGIGLLADGARGQEDHARRGKTVGRALLGFHHRQIGVGRKTEHAGEIRHRLADLFAVGLRHVGLGPAEIEGGGDAFAGDARRSALHDGDAAGKRGALELDLVARLVAGGFLAVVAGAQHGVARRHGDAHVGGETVGGVAAYGEPARRVQQEAEIGMDGGELDAVDRRILLPGEFAVVVEGDGDGLALDEGLIEVQAHAEVLLVAGRLNLLALVVHHARHVERVVQFEGGGGDVVVQGHEAHTGLGGEGLRVRRDLGVNGVLLHVDAGAAVLRQGGARAADAERQSENEGERTVTRHESLVLPEYP